MRTLVEAAVRRRISVLMAALAVTAFGIVGYDRLSLDLLPDITYPSLTVQTEFPDTAPAEVENLVTRPVEETVGVLRGLQSIHSVSRSGVSEVTLEFEWGADMDMLAMDIREKLDRMNLPDETEPPIVLRFDPSLDPILRVAITGTESLVNLRQVAEKRLKQELETIPGVASAQIRGGAEEEIQIDVDQERLAALGIPVDRVRQVVQVSNINLPGGMLRGEENSLLIRMVNEYATVEEIGNLIVHQQRPTEGRQLVGEGGIVRIRDVATVSRGTKEREEISRLGGNECIEVAIFKEGDANTVQTARHVRENMDHLKTLLPPGSEMTVLFDQSRFIEKAVNEVRYAALIGGVLAIIVLFSFLRDLRSTLIIATSIPLSVVATFVAMYRMDLSLNIMSLGGLTLGIGMLVDNSIVVLESIYRYRERGFSLWRAAVSGTSEVSGAVLAATLTTVAVFLPIVFVEGIAGQLFRDMALTVTFSLLASLIVALTLIPMLSALGDRSIVAGAHLPEGADAGRSDRPDDLPLGAEPPEAGDVQPQRLGGLSRFYGVFLDLALRNRFATVAMAGLLFVAALVLAGRLGTELIPQVEEGEFFFEVKLPEGTPLAATDRVMQVMETDIEEAAGVAHYYSSVGTRQVTGGLSLNTKAENLGQVNVVMADRSDREGQVALLDSLRVRFEQIPDLESKSGMPTYFSLKTPIEVVLFGEDVDLLRDYSLTLQERIGQLPGLVDVRSSLEAGSPELRVVFDRARLAALGLDMGNLSETLRNRVAGVVPTRFKEDDRQIDIRVRNREEDRASVADVRNLMVPGPDGQQIRLLTVADITEDRGPAEIHRLQQQRAAVVTANLEGRSLGSAVDGVNQVLAQNPPPSGVTVDVGGQNAEMKVSFASLRFAIGLAVFLVYLVMAATFESLLHPFIVLFSVPLALVGAVPGLWITGTEISVIVLIGAVMLVGIVVNNAIVLIDKINQLRRGGMEKRAAVVRAGHLRLRPILMTTTTTVLGLVPMALSVGEGSELRTPIAITVSSGLLLSTVLTLVVIPAIYMLVPSRIGEVAVPRRLGLPGRSPEGGVSPT